ncbi:hypothetical protein DFQ05_1156 [Winogradskyella wandonensis]|uniref:Uncharacterized protein n=1 Tax=Winogradskyella wandonensis TaxID=1442586 RepID=A0A4R1KQT9_9FLAO|nr:hypothetical protein [Winogradskyella wandonensis]TCK67382.1 hypothetical protein DFQ05_1156 [Winogradskyella wandonensis]
MKKTIIFYSALILTLLSCSKDNDDTINQSLSNKNEKIQLSPLEEITQDSDLFRYLLEISSDNENPNESITCINFNYTLSVFIFDENNEFVSLNAVTDDDDFSDLLGNLDDNFSISISFPISATLESGEAFTITNKEELRQSIDNCLDIERVGECNAFLEDCKFRVGYSFDGENTYLGGIFEESSGLTTFTFEGEDYIGSWTALSIESELHININLVEANEDITEFFNYDWIVEYLDDNSIKLTNQDREIILHKKCDIDFDLCASLLYEVCENEPNSEISDFVLSDYEVCIIDILDINENSEISFHETLEDAENNLNAITADDIYNNTENNQSIFVKIVDEDNMSEYIVEIILVSVGC